MIYKPEKKVFSVINCCILQLVEGHHLNVCSWLLCSLPLFSNNNQKKNSITNFLWIFIYPFFVGFFLPTFPSPLNQLLQYTSSWDVSCYSVVGWDWAKYVQPVKFGPLQPAVVSTVNDRKPCPVYFFFCVGFIFTFSFKIAVMWVLLSAADCA